MGNQTLISKILHILCVLLGMYVLTVLSDDDCWYMTCAKKLRGDPGGFHEPCLGANGRSLLRDVECVDGNIIHICCKMPYPTDVLKSRKNWFRFVKWTGEKAGVSPSSIKRILCELSCKDGLKGQTRSNYPEVLPDDSPENREFADAFMQGESLSCYNHDSAKERNLKFVFSSTDKGPKICTKMSFSNRPSVRACFVCPKPTADKSKEQQGNQYAFEFCEKDCRSSYPECDKHMEDSLKTEYIYEASRMFHKLGMWWFSANWLLQDTFERAMEMGAEATCAVETAYELLEDRMHKMNKAFSNWLTSRKSDGDEKDSTDKKRIGLYESGSDDVNTSKQFNRLLIG